VDPTIDQSRAKNLEKRAPERIIPPEVIEVMKSGKPWYTVRWNNELERMVRTEEIEALMQMLQAITAIAGLYPMIVEAVNWYDLLKDLNDALDCNNKILVKASEFKQIVAKVATENRAMMTVQAQQGVAQARQSNSQANKNNAEAQLNA
jgi:hypothetical protein